MQIKLRILLSLAVLAFVVGISAHADEASLVGTWTLTAAGGGGGGGRGGPQTITFTMDGGKLAGTMSGGQNGTPLQNLTVSGDSVSFSVTRNGRNGATTQNYTGKVSGDEIDFKVKTEGQDQERDVTAKKNP